MNVERREFEREHMVEVQLARRGIADPRVLHAMRLVPRELFVPESSQQEAYADAALAIGQGQTISQPYIVARTCELAAIQPQDRVLEVGGGSGYQAAVLSHLARDVVAVERLPELAEQARARLRRLQCDNVEIVIGDGCLGHPAGAPYDVIVVAAGTDQPSPAWFDQLAEGGRLVAPLGSRGAQALTVLTRHGDSWTRQVFDRCLFVPLIRSEDE